jgi:hypothetical protein
MKKDSLARLLTGFQPHESRKFVPGKKPECEMVSGNETIDGKRIFQDGVMA